MATYEAIATASAALLGLLQNASDELRGGTPQFRLATSADLQKSTLDDLSISLYLYHVGIDVSRRTAAARLEPSGARRLPALPLDLHYLLTAWAKDARRQQALLGWAVRTIQDTPILPTGVLNSYSNGGDVFRQDETLEILWEELSQQDIFDVWEVARSKQQPSVCYLVRGVELESTSTTDYLPIVQSTGFHSRQVLR